MTCIPSQVARNCSGAVGSGTELFNYWETHNCPAAYSQLINSGTGESGYLQYNETCMLVARNLVTELFQTYLETNSITNDVTSTSYNTFQETLIELCTDPILPGICSEFLTGYCSTFTRDEVSESPVLIDFCGCYTSPDPTYLQYTLGSSGCEIGTGCTAGCTSGNTGCTGQPACDPLCHRVLTSQKAYLPTGNLITCPQSICVIDDVTVNVTSSRVPGGINFNSVCSGCGGASGSDGCLCIVSGINVSSTMSQVGVGTNFNDFCGTASICIVEDNAGNILSEGTCTGINPSNIGVSGGESVPNLGISFIMILLVLLVFFLALTARYTYKENDKK